jgi:pimeloyl-ACP methyl ester carboxylesterase
MLRGRPDIDPGKIGLWGLSQGAWLAPLAASQSAHVAFLIAVSGGGVTPAEQEYFDDEIKLRDLKFPEPDIADAVDLLKMADNVIRQRESWDTFARARAAAAEKPWFKHLDAYPVKIPRQAPVWTSGDPDLDFDPAPVWEKVHVPVLAIVGELDKSTPAAPTAERLETFQRRAGNRDVTIRTFPGANHGLWVERTTEGQPDWDRPAAGWLELMLQWLDKRR